MRVFITGATGFIGGAVAAGLRDAGHEVAALVRPDSEIESLRARGVTLVTGDLLSLPSIDLTPYDLLVHTAQSKNDTVGADREAVDSFTAARGHFIYTSGPWVLGNTTDADEGSAVNPLPLVAWRPAHEERAIMGGGVVIRPGCVYGGRQSLLADWFTAAEQHEPLTVIGDGKNRWAMVHLADLVDLYLRAADQRATGVLHGIDDSHDTLTRCAAAVAPNAAIEYTEFDDAREQLGAFADGLLVDQVIDSTETRRKVGWQPRHSFLASVEQQWREWRAASV